MTHLEVVAAHFTGIYNSFCAYCFNKLVASGVMSAFLFLFGANNNLVLQALIALVVIDFITAIGGAFESKTPIESRRALKSATKLVVYALFIIAGHLTSEVIQDKSLIEYAVLCFLALTEFISIMENIGKMGFMVPQKLLNQVRDLRNKQ